MNGYRKHCNEAVGNFARCLVTKWKEIVQLATETAASEVSVSSCERKVDEPHSESSQCKRLCTSSNPSASKSHHLPAAVKNNKTDKQDSCSTAFSNLCSQSKVSAATHSIPVDNDQPGDGSNSSQNHSAVSKSTHVSASTKCRELSVGSLSSLSNSSSTGSKSRREKHCKLSKSTTDDKSKETCPLNSKASVKISKSKSVSNTENHSTMMGDAHADFATDRKSHESEREFISDDHIEADLNRSLRKNASSTKGEKKSPNICISDRCSIFEASAKTHGHDHRSKHRNQADIKTFTAAGDMDGDECSGMTFEQMLNYDSYGSVARKKKGNVHGIGKHSKVPKLALHSSLLKLPSVPKDSSKPDSGHVLKHTSCEPQMSIGITSADSDVLERLQQNKQPVIPHPDSQVGIGFLTLL